MSTGLRELVPSLNQRLSVSWPAVGLLLVLFLVIGEAWSLRDRWQASRAAAIRLDARVRELAALEETTPAPTAERAAAIAADLARAGQALAAMQAELGGRGLENAPRSPMPGSRAEAYFDLAAFVDQTRGAARNRGIRIAPGAVHLGFSEYANEGPALEWIEEVFQQRQLAQFLFGLLFECQPRALLGVKRGMPGLGRDNPLSPPTGNREAVRRHTGSAQPAGADYFRLDPAASLRRPSLIETLPFQLEFIGQTGTLREFLNRLAVSAEPVWVREIGVEPIMVEEPAPAAAAADSTTRPGFEADRASSFVLAADARPAGLAGSDREELPRPVPIVGRSWSKFTVTLERIEPVASQPVEVAHAPVRLRRWEPPPPQSRGRDWIYDTFTPPEIFHDPLTGRFSVHPPATLADERVAEDFGLELVAVHPEPFPLQLLGYAGAPGKWLGTFEHAASGAVFVAGAGRHLREPGFTIRSVEVHFEPAPPEATLRRRIVTARVHDPKADREVVLTGGVRCFGDAASASVAAGGDPTVHRVWAGETLRLADVVFRIDCVVPVPPAIQVTRDPEGPEPKVRWLNPGPRETAGDPAQPGGPADSILSPK